MTQPEQPDGVHALVPRDRMSESARKMRDIYAITPGAPIHHEEFGFMEGTPERWREEGMPQDITTDEHCCPRTV